MNTYATCNLKNTHLSKRTWYCILCDKNRIVNSKSGHISSIFKKRRGRFLFTVKIYEFDNPEFNQKDNIFKHAIKGCDDKYFHIFECRCEHNTKIEHKTSGEVLYFTIFNCLELFSSQTDRLCKKIDE